MTSVVRLKPCDEADSAQEGQPRRSAVPWPARIPSSPDCSGTWRCRPTVGVSRSAATSLSLDVVHLDRREAEPRQARRGARLAHEPRQVVAGLAIPVAAEVDAGEHDLAMTLVERGARSLAAPPSARRLREAPRTTRDHAERAREAAAVLHLDEGADAIEPRFRLDARDRADVACDGRRRLLARLAGRRRRCPRGPRRRPAGRFAAQPVT